MKFVIEKTLDGSLTLRHPVTGDTYHSLRGAVGEALHVFISGGLAEVANRAKVAATEADTDKTNDAESGDKTSCRTAISILEVGFGSSLNALLTLEYGELNGLRIDYTGIELYPVDIETALELGYSGASHFVCLHEAPWGQRTAITDRFTLTKIEADFTKVVFTNASRAESNCEQSGCGVLPHTATFDLVYFDAFARETQPEMWSSEIFTKLHDAMNAGGILVTYSVAGAVKRALAEAGFSVERLAGALGKRHMLRATK